MLEVTILKTTQKGAEEARKLQTYMDECDVFATEEPNTDEETARQTEEGWEDLLLKSASYAKQFQLKGYKELGLGEEEAKYFLQLGCQLHQAQKPILVVERFSKENKKKLDGIKYSAKLLEEEALEALRSDQKERFQRLSGRCLNQYITWIRERDKEIARNIAICEPLLRERIQYLAQKPNIKLCVEAMAVNSPERFLEIPSKIITLYDLLKMPPLLRKEIAIYHKYDSNVPPIQRTRWGLLHRIGEPGITYTEVQIAK